MLRLNLGLKYKDQRIIGKLKKTTNKEKNSFRKTGIEDSIQTVSLVGFTETDMNENIIERKTEENKNELTEQGK